MFLKRLNIIMLLVCAPVLAGAQISLRDVWLSMPDEMIPYLNKNLRLEHLDFVDMGVKSEVNHQMNGASIMDTLTADYTNVTLSNSSTLELRLLPVNDSTKIICMVRTFKAPAEESEIHFYDTSWNLLSDEYGLEKMKNQDNADAEELLSRFVQKPDTMSSERFDELCKLIEPVMVSASFDVTEPVLKFRLSIPLATPEDRKQLDSILLQRRFRWNGRTFTEIQG